MINDKKFARLSCMVQVQMKAETAVEPSVFVSRSNSKLGEYYLHLPDRCPSYAGKVVLGRRQIKKIFKYGVNDLWPVDKPLER